MGVSYQRWLIARGNVFSPGAAAVAKLVERLREEKWIAERGHAVKTVECASGDHTEPLPGELTPAWLDAPDREEIRLVWPASGDASSAVTYPLTQRPDGAAPWALEIHRATEYVVPVAKGIGPLACVCACGEDLAFEWDIDELVPAFEASTGIFAECEDCSRTFDPSKSSARIVSPFGGKSEDVRGGAAYRFAVKVDCGASFVEDAALAFAPELAALVAKHFGRELYEVGALR